MEALNNSDAGDGPPISRLTSISNELITIIFKNLDAPSAICLALTCKFFKAFLSTLCEQDITVYDSLVDDNSNPETQPPEFIKTLPSHNVPRNGSAIWSILKAAKQMTKPILTLNRRHAAAIHWKSYIIPKAYFGLYFQLRNSAFVPHKYAACWSKGHAHCPYEIPHMEEYCKLCN